MFSITINTPLVIYGCSIQAQNHAKVLLSSGYTINAFIDVRAESIKQIFDISVYGLTEFVNISQNKDDVVIVICLQDILQHWKVAEVLVHAGFHHIVYLPSDKLLHQQEIRIMRNMYSLFQDNCMNQLKNIPDSFIRPNKNDYPILHRVGGRIVTFVPGFRLYSQSISDINKSGIEFISEKIVKQIASKNIYCCKPYWDLFSYIANQQCSPSDYLDMMVGKDQMKRELLFANRCKLYNLFINQLNNGINFFIDSAASCKLGENGKIIILDGLHRSIFLLFMGLSQVPVSLCKKDFENLVNNGIREEISEYCVNNIKSTDSFEIKPESDNYYTKLASSILRFFESINLDNMVIYDLSHANGFYSLIFSQLNARVNYIYNSSYEKHYCELYFTLHNLENIPCTINQNAIVDDCLNILLNDVFSNTNIRLFISSCESPKYVIYESNRYENEYLRRKISDICHLDKIARLCSKTLNDGSIADTYIIF